MRDPTAPNRAPSCAQRRRVVCSLVHDLLGRPPSHRLAFLALRARRRDRRARNVYSFERPHSRLLPRTIGCSADADTARTQTHDGWRRAELTGEDATASAQAETVEGVPFGEFQDLLIVEIVLLVPGFFFLAA